MLKVAKNSKACEKCKNNFSVVNILLPYRTLCFSN